MSSAVTFPRQSGNREPVTHGRDLEDIGLSLEVQRALRATGYLSLRGADVGAHFGVVSLQGRVPSYYVKQLAQATALGVPGVCGVHNELEVTPKTALVPRCPTLG